MSEIRPQCCKFTLVDGSEIIAIDKRLGGYIGFGKWKILKVVDQELMDSLIKTRIDRRKGIVFFLKIKESTVVYLELNYNRVQR